MPEPHQGANALRARLPQTRVYLDRPHAYREVNACIVCARAGVRARCVCALASLVFVRELMSTLHTSVRSCVCACVWLAFNVCAVLDQAPARHSANYRFTEGSMHGPGILDDTRIVHVSYGLCDYTSALFFDTSIVCEDSTLVLRTDGHDIMLCRFRILTPVC